LKQIKINVRILTNDNGKEFAYYTTRDKIFEPVLYFANPYSSLQRSLNKISTDLSANTF